VAHLSARRDREDSIGELTRPLERDVVPGVELHQQDVRERARHTLSDFFGEDVRTRAADDEGGALDRLEERPSLGQARSCRDDLAERVRIGAPDERASVVTEPPLDAVFVHLVAIPRRRAHEVGTRLFARSEALRALGEQPRRADAALGEGLRTGVDDHERADAIGIATRKIHRVASAHRVSDDDRALDRVPIQDRERVGHELGRRVAICRPPAFAVPADLRALVDRRELLADFAWRELRARYKGSVLGFAWNFVNPLLQLLVFWLLFGVVLRTRPITASGEQPYAIFLFVGLLPWTFFATSLQQGSAAILANGALVKKVRMPLQLLPAASVLSALANFVL